MKHINKYLIIIFLVVFSGSVLAQEKQKKTPDIRFRITAGVNFYKAFSQKKNSMVMKMGYPVFEGMQLQIGGGVSLTGNKATHHLNINILHIPVMSSNDGLGNNFLLQKSNSNMTSIQLEYQMQRNLYSHQGFKMDYASLAGLDVQIRNLTYNSGAKKETSDFSFFFGIRSLPSYQISNVISLQAGFDSFFYLPYLNTGTLKKWNDQDKQIEETTYHAFYYRTRLHTSLNYMTKAGKQVRLGYRNEKTVGFANSEPLFYIDELIHHRMNQYHNIFLEYEF
jgi:phenylpropionate dioxygenase-like ring-hydroxylating dioxygenase large terminal subunit